jgi:hypothetical protein
MSDGFDDDTPASLAECLDTVEVLLKRFVVFPSVAEPVAIALWCAHTHAFGAADVTPYVHVRSPEPQCGKTLLLEVIELLVREPWRASGVSEAVLFRRIARDAPTVLLDELDTVFTGAAAKMPEASAVRQVLNAGNRRNAVVSRCAQKGEKLVDFCVFAPKVLAGIGALPPTLADRAIPIVLARKKPDEPVRRFRRRDVEGGLTLVRDRLAEWAETAEDALRVARPRVPDVDSDRLEEAWEPLLAISELAGGPWPDRARTAMIALHAKPSSQTVNVLLLSAIRDVFAELGQTRVFTVDLLYALVNRETEPWPGWWGKEVDRTWGSTPRGPSVDLARHLRDFDVQPKTVRLGEKTDRGYALEDFTDAFERYLPQQHAPLPKPDPFGHNVTPHATEEVSQPEDSELVASNAAETSVAAQGVLHRDGREASQVETVTEDVTCCACGVVGPVAGYGSNGESWCSSCWTARLA